MLATSQSSFRPTYQSALRPFQHSILVILCKKTHNNPEKHTVSCSPHQHHNNSAAPPPKHNLRHRIRTVYEAKKGCACCHHCHMLSTRAITTHIGTRVGNHSLPTCRVRPICSAMPMKRWAKMDRYTGSNSSPTRLRPPPSLLTAPAEADDVPTSPTSIATSPKAVTVAVQPGSTTTVETS